MSQQEKINISKNIRALRRNSHLSQEMLAEKLFISRDTLRRWEKAEAEPKVSDVVSIGKIFKIYINELLFSNIEEIGINFVKSFKEMKELDGISTNTAETVISDTDRAIPLISPESLPGYQFFKKAYDLNVNMEKTGDDSCFVEMMTLYERAFDNGVIEAGINILNVIVGIMVDIKSTSPGHDLIFDVPLRKYIEELEEISHPAGTFFRAYAIGSGLLNNDKSEEESLDEGIYLMNFLANNGNKYAQNFINYIERLEF